MYVNVYVEISIFLIGTYSTCLSFRLAGILPLRGRNSKDQLERLVRDPFSATAGRTEISTAFHYISSSNWNSHAEPASTALFYIELCSGLCLPYFCVLLSRHLEWSNYDPHYDGEPQATFARNA